MNNLITIKAVSVRDNKNGTFAIEFPAAPIPPEKRKVLEELFPDLLDSAYSLLNKQALLKMIATDAEAEAEPNNCHTCGKLAPTGSKFCEDCDRRPKRKLPIDPVS